MEYWIFETSTAEWCWQLFVSPNIPVKLLLIWVERLAGVNVGFDVLPGDFGFEHVGRAAKESAFCTCDGEISSNLVSDLLGGASWHELLRADGSVE